MKFQILADDVASCNQLTENLRVALKQLRMEFPVEMDVSPGRAASLQAEPPVLAEDGRVISAGRILSPEEISELLRSLHRSEITELQKAAERGKQRAHLMKGIFLALAVLCCVFAIGNEIRQRRNEAARDAARPAALHFTEPVKMLYFYRRPRLKSDVDQEVLLRRIVYAVYPEEIKRNLFTVESLDADRPENAAAVRNFRIREVPAVILLKNGKHRQLVPGKEEHLQTRLMRAVDSLK